MKKEGLLFFTDTNLTLLALVIFVTVFSIFVFRIFSKNKKSQLEYESKLPFDEGVQS